MCPELEKCLFLLLWKVLSVPIAKDKLSQLSESNLSTKLEQCLDVESKLPPSQNIEFSYVFLSVLVSLLENGKHLGCFSGKVTLC